MGLEIAFPCTAGLHAPQNIISTWGSVNGAGPSDRHFAVGVGRLDVLRAADARHLLMNGIQINYLSRWLGHSSIQTTHIYLELVPDPSGSLDRAP